MDLKNLPAYLNSLRSKGEFGDGVVVDMGKIVAPRSNVLRNTAFAVSICVLLGLVTFGATSQKITVVTNSGISAEEVYSIVSDNGGQVVSMIKNEDNTYSMRVFSFRLGSFIEKLRKNKDIVELK